MRDIPDGASSLFDVRGRRKYLCASEHRRFLEAASRTDAETRAFCMLLALTGCRISEALSLSGEGLDPETGRVVFRTLKRRKPAFRAVPIPPELMLGLRQLAKGRSPQTPLWAWCRVTAWRRVKMVMALTGITGAHAMPKGLRHGYAVACAEQNVPQNLIQRWLGHSRLETSAIYMNAVGQEESAFAKRVWRRSLQST